MKRPQLNGNKIVTRYTDATSIALRNYIDISAQRLNKVRAGKHLVSVLKSDTNDLMRRHQQTPDLGRLDMDREPMSLNGFSSHRSEKPGTSGKQILLSDFMGTYLTQKNIDEDLLSKKEDNIYHFFKEKFGLMGKYLGEDVLKAGLAGKASRQEAERPRKFKNNDYESREQHPTKNNNEEAGLESKEDPASRINHINREIMGMILKEEHDKEMEALMQLQTEQNMQVFNDLQDIGYKDSDKKASSLAPARISPTKMILKNNFLRHFVELPPETPQQRTEEKFYASGYRTSKKKHTATNSRPQSEYLVFRTHQKKEAVVPDIDRISSQFDNHKFGKKTAPAFHHIKNVPSTGGLESMNTQEDVDRLKVARQLSLSKLDAPQVTVTAESVRHKTRVDTANMKENVSTVKSIKTLIGEEIEFLNNNRDPNRQRANTAMEKVRVPSRFVKQQQVVQIENRHVRSQGDTNTQENEMVQKDTSLSQRSIQTREGKRQVLQDMKKNIPISKSQTRIGATFEENNTQLQGIRIVKKNVAHISPKTDVNSFKFAVQTPVIKGQVTLKRDVKNAISSSIQSRTTQNLNSLLEINSEKPSVFTKKKDQGYLHESDALASTDYLTGSSSVKTNTKGFIFDQRSGSGSNLLMKPNFGNKYWRNTFND